MKKIAMVGATGSLGGMIIDELLKHDAELVAVVRQGTDAEKIAKLTGKGVVIKEVDMTNVSELTNAIEGVEVVVSALQGLRDVVVDVQSRVLDAAVAAHVKKFIPSDYSTDYSVVPEGENRNFDLRREFRTYLDSANISATSIFNGAFAEILRYGTPLLDTKNKTAGYWGSADWKMDFSTMQDTAAFTAHVAMDADSPRNTHIASFQVSANDLAVLASELSGDNYEIKDRGSVDGLGAYAKSQREAHPEGEQEIFPEWQQLQYMHGMVRFQHESLDNNRYPTIVWTTASDFLGSLLKKK